MLWSAQLGEEPEEDQTAGGTCKVHALGLMKLFRCQVETS